MKSIFKILFVFSCFLSASTALHASHLMGGNLAYEYLGNNGDGTFKYRIIFKTYTNCDANSQITTPESQVTIAIFTETANPNDDKPFYQTLLMNLNTTQQITPDLPNGCTVGVGTCINEGVYIETIDLPLSPNGVFSNGYHLYYDRCCRNGSVLNLANPGNQGMGFYAFIPPPLVNNSSPVFTDLPLPFICVGDTISILNSAVDPDGDLLIFSFETPYKGYSTGTNNGGNDPGPAPNYTTNQFQPNFLWPIPKVNWKTGFDKNKIFGLIGGETINGFTGQSAYYATAQGNYVVAVEIKEFRNGNLIGVSRRDMQLLVVACPNNPTAQLTNGTDTNGNFSGQTSFTIEEGDSLCFALIFDDPNNNNLTFTAEGGIFTSSNPAALINSPVTGAGSVSSTFCWKTICGQGQALPYLFNVKVVDDGCAPKTAAQVYSIKVIPFVGPTAITGITTVCSGQSGVTYTVNAIAGATYNWLVNGGTITSGNTTNTITVNWGNGTIGDVSVVATSQFGCTAPSINKLVTINPVIINAGIDTSLCSGGSIVLGGNPTGPSGFTYSWSPSVSLNNANFQNPLATPATTTQYVVTASNGANCSSTDTITVSVGNFNISITPPTAICFGTSIQLNTYGGDSYNWSPIGLLNNSTIANPIASPTNTTQFVVTITSGLCSKTDSTIITVSPNNFGNAGGDVWLCPGDSVQLNASGGVSYNWIVLDSLINPNSPTPTVFPSDTTTYIVEITDANGCISSDSVTVFAAPLVPTNAGLDKTICEGDSVVIGGNPTAPNGTIYLWNNTLLLNNASVANPLSFSTSTTNFIVTTTNSICFGTDTIKVIVHPKPTLIISPTQQICLGDSAQLTTSGGISYQWLSAVSLSNNAIPNPKVSPTDTTSYFVTVTDNFGCMNTGSTKVEVNFAPAITVTNNSPICTNDTALLIITPSTGLTYNWLSADSLLQLGNDTAFTYSHLTKYYFISVTDGNGCSNFDSTLVTVNPLPIANAGVDVWLCKSSSLQLQATGGISYLWSPLINIMNENTVNPTVNPLDTTNYIVQVTDVNNCINSDTVEVAVNTIVPTFAGNDTTICFGNTVSIGGNPTSLLGTTFLWNNGSLLDNNTAANPLASPNSTTVFIVSTTNNICNGTDTVKITILSLPLANAGNSQQICIGDSALLVATGGIIYNWDNSPVLSNTNNDTTFVFPTDTTTFQLTVTDANGCSNTDSILLIVNPLPTANAGLNIEICFGDTTQLIASGGIIYLWSPNDSIDNQNNATPNVFPSVTTEYIVLVTDSNSCINSDSVIVTVNPLPLVDAGIKDTICFGETTQLNASGATNYLWSPNVAINNINSNSPLVFPSNSLYYTVEGTDTKGCFASDSVLITVNPLPLVNAGNDIQICIGLSANLSASGATIYTWNADNSLSDSTIFNPNATPFDTTNYIVIGTDNNGCKNSDTITVIVNPLPIVNAGLDTLSCSGGTLILGGTPTGPTGSQYAWLPIAGISNPTNANPTINPTKLITYSVLVTDTNSCVNADSITIKIFTLLAIKDTTVCSNQSVQITATPQFGHPDFSYEWDTNNANDTLSFITISPNSNSNYAVTVTDAYGCVDSISNIIVTVNAVEQADFEFSAKATCNGMKVTFTNNSLNTSEVLWLFNDGTMTNSFEPEHLFPFGQNMETTLITTDDNNCTDTLKLNESFLKFEDIVNVNPPNVFTPNNDGVNDAFGLQGDFAISECVELKIYNRWGVLLFESNGFNTTWNGRTFAGVKVPAGTYFYTIKVKKIEKRGSLTLLR